MSALLSRVKEAIENDPMIVVPENRIMHSQGFSEQYMQEIGLRRTDLKKLERQGMAFRAYIPRPPRPNQLSKLHSGYETRWMLVKDAEEETDERSMDSDSSSNSG